MATKNRARMRDPTLVTHEGAPAKRIDAEAQLRRSVMACLLWERTFYEEGEDIADRIAGLVDQLPLETCAAIAIEAREQQHLRHVPLWIARQMARRGGKTVGDTIARVIQRADEITEFLALYWADGRQPLSAQVKRGLGEAFAKFDEYQLAKYDRGKKDITLRDAMFLSHPKPDSVEQASLWGRLVDGELATPDTWEVALSGGEDKREAWTRLLTERRLGGLALLRNLRNMEQADVDRAVIKDAIDVNPFHRVLPFRFIAAARHAPSLEPELESAMFRALLDTPKLHGRTVLLVDVSGSMSGPLSSRSQLQRLDAAAGLAMLLREVCDDVRICVFSNDAAEVPARRGFALHNAIRRTIPMMGTHTERGKALVDTLGYDRLIVLTDEQSHTRISDPQGIGYFVNIATYKNGIGYGKWVHIDGWSDQIVRYIHESESAATT